MSLLPAVLVLALALPAAAQGATVSVFVPYCAPEQSKYGACYPDEARFAAAPGEVNRLTVVRTVEPPRYVPHAVFRDQGARVEAGAGCTQVDEHTADCTGYLLAPVVDAGDGDDVVSGDGTFSGGPGDDNLSGATSQTGGPGNDQLRAGDSSSSLDGGPGSDSLHGGNGSDRLLDGGSAGERDAVDGGGGSDTLDYTGRATGVTVSLGQPGAEDQLTAIENLRGGDGPDLLTGDAAANQIEGGGGADTVSGGDGDDFLDGGAGADVLAGGAGADRLDGGSGRGFDSLACGDGSDAVQPKPTSLIGADCEVIGLDEFDLGGAARLFLPLSRPRGRILTFEPLGCVYLPCRVSLLVSGRGRLIGSTSVVQRTGGARLPRRLALRLSGAGTALLRRTRTLRARVKVVTREQGETSVTSFLVDLERPG